MAWTFTDLPYGWKIAAGIALTGGTIFVADNILHRITAPTVIELVLGTTERCLATQYQTNPVAYRVAPPSFVETWYSNSYNGTNVTLHTATVTNTIGWRLNRAMVADLDAKIKALVPFYCDTNYNALTVTGLWASLGIGDHTNKFTSTPSIGTNPATYGDLPYRLYEEDLVERYKVLNALSNVWVDIKSTLYFNHPNYTYSGTLHFGGDHSSWAKVKSTVDENWPSGPMAGAVDSPEVISTGFKWATNYYDALAAIITIRSHGLVGLNTNLSKRIYLYVYGVAPTVYENSTFNSFGDSVTNNGWSLWTVADVGYSPTALVEYDIGRTSNVQPGWCSEPLIINEGIAKGWKIGDYKAAMSCDFSYCRNKFW